MRMMTSFIQEVVVISFMHFLKVMDFLFSFSGYNHLFVLDFVG